MRYNILFTLLAVLGLFSCASSCKDEVDVSSIKVDLKVTRLEQEMRQFGNMGDAEEFVKQQPAFADFLLATTFPNNEIMAQRLYALGTSKEIKPLFNDVNRVFGDFSSYEKGLKNLFKHVKYYYPEFTTPEVNTLVTGFGGVDLAQGEDAIFIGLDYFLGDQSEFKPVDFPEYILRYYKPENLVYKTALMLSKRFNESDPGDKTLLAYMIYYGKAYYFVQKTIPCISEQQVTEYQEEEIKAIHEYGDFIWSHFVTKQLFFETNRLAITKYVDERPYVTEVADKCPGRIGRWLGYQIVKAYMEEHPDLTLNELMKETNSKKIFEESKYQPKSN